MSTNDYLLNLNEKQKQAVTMDLCATLVVAGAGSGKTTILVNRILYLVQNIGFNPKRILGFTFTNKAANEMKKRIINTINASFEWIGTFHSICLKILKYDSSHIGRQNNFLIIDADSQLSIIKDIYIKLGIDKNDLSHKKCIEYIEKLKSYRLDDSEIEEFVFDPQSPFVQLTNSWKKIIIKTYKEYINVMISNNLFDFDDLIFYTLKLFNENKNILQKWQNKFDYILVDEFQDTNIDQYELIKLLSKDKTNIFVVGDPDQMIYSWRGAHNQIFNDYINDFNDVKTIILDKNYRSTKAILNISNDLISNNSKRIKKELYTDNDNGSKIIYYNANYQDKESSWVIDKIRQLIHAKKYNYNDIAILYRSNFTSRNIEQALVRANFPYYIYGGFKFYDRKEVKDIIAYLKLICNNDDISLSRIYNTPKRKISETTLTKIKEYSYKNNISLYDAFNKVDEIDIPTASKNACKSFMEMIDSIKEAKKTTLVDLYNEILDKTKYLDMLVEINEEYRKENLDELKNAIADYEFRNPSSTLVDYLQEISLYTSSENDEKNKNSILLMTVHLSKGLEFKNVFIIDFNEGIFPSQKSIEMNDIEEERRIAYVAMTRAKENLFISSSNGFTFHSDSKIQKMPSRFIDEISKSPHFEVVIDNNYKPLSKMDLNWFDTKGKDNSYEHFFHEEDQKFEIGDVIVHTKFEDGVIVGINDDMLEVSFRHPYGKKTIMKNHKSIKRKLS